MKRWIRNIGLAAGGVLVAGLVMADTADAGVRIRVGDSHRGRASVRRHHDVDRSSAEHWRSRGRHAWRRRHPQAHRYVRPRHYRPRLRYVRPYGVDRLRCYRRYYRRGVHYSRGGLTIIIR